MASSGWQGFVTLQSGGFGYNFFKGNLRINSISHSGNTVTVNADFGVYNDGGQNSYYYYPIKAKIRDITNYQQVVAGQDWINTNSWKTSGVNFSFEASSGSTSANITVDWLYNNDTASNSITYTLYFDASYQQPGQPNVTIKNISATGARFTVSGNYGIPSSASGRYIEAAILDQNSYGGTYKYNIASNTSSADITVSNSTYYGGGLTILPNKQYYYGGYIDNTQGHNSVVTGQFVTLPEVAVASITKVGSDMAQFSWSVEADGGHYDKTVSYSLDSGSYTTIGTYSGGSARSGDEVLLGLSPNTQYTLNMKNSTTAGASIKGSSLITLSAEPTITQESATNNSVLMGFSFAADGGAYDKTIVYTIDGGVNWITAGTITGGGAASGTFNVENLQPGTSYNLIVRVTTGAGTITLDDMTITTGAIVSDHYAFYGPAGEASSYAFSYSNLSDPDGIIGEEH